MKTKQLLLLLILVFVYNILSGLGQSIYPKLSIIPIAEDRYTDLAKLPQAERDSILLKVAKFTLYKF